MATWLRYLGGGSRGVGEDCLSQRVRVSISRSCTPSRLRTGDAERTSERRGGMLRLVVDVNSDRWGTVSDSNGEMRSRSDVDGAVALDDSFRFCRFVFPGPFAFAYSTRTFEPHNVFPSNASITSAASLLLTNSTNAKPGGWCASHTSIIFPKRLHSSSRSSFLTVSAKPPMYNLFCNRLGVFFFG